MERKILALFTQRKGPNRVGRDVFYLTRVPKDGGGIQPYGYDASNDSVEKACSKGLNNGNFCVEKIRRAGWKIEKDYPWK